ncbi:hypothetical protein K438DRAFT_1562614 [Mycena galopus ATCC 62051]|nr:hypothetical protein K438DRAFT_1562614 [Mycena galopus ATCC 62051]
MLPVLSHLDSHVCDTVKFSKNLKQAREDAAKARGYKSAPTCAQLRNEFSKRNNGMQAHEWPVDVAEAIILGLDVTLIAGTGTGKTMPFVVPLFVETEKIVLIVSPLNALEADQVRVVF